jgi:hypothetical protein
LTVPESRQAVGAAELYADGYASAPDLRALAAIARRDRYGAVFAAVVACISDDAAYAANTRKAAPGVAYLAAMAVGNASHPRDWKASKRAELEAQSELLRCVFGNPFRPTTKIQPAWLDHNGRAKRLAQGIYDDRAFHWEPRLADALEDAGCTDAELLGHLRGPGPHVRGCWAVDLLLAKQ